MPVRDRISTSSTRLGVLAAATLAGAGVALALPGAVSRAVDAGVAGEGAGGPLAIVGALLGAALLISATASLWGSYVIADRTREVRRALTAKVFRLGLKGSATFPAGDVTARTVGSAAESAALGPIVIDVGATVLVSAGAVVLLGLLDWTLALSLVVGVTPAVVLLLRLMGQGGALAVEYQTHQAQLSVLLTEALAGGRTIRAAGSVSRESTRVLRPLKGMAETGRRLWTVQTAAAWKAGFLIPMVQVLVLAVAGLRLSQGVLSAGGFLAAVGYTSLALRIVEEADTLFSIAQAQAGGRRVTQVLDAPEHRADGSPTTGDGEDGTLRADAVTVDGALTSVTLSITAGSNVALVGGAGAGKSVLAAVLGGLLPPDQGEVRVGGVRWPDLPPAMVSSYAGFAFERPLLLGDTLAEALGPGDPYEATRLAHADHFLARLPDGLSTPLDSLHLSGGELQRLGLARALARNPRLLVLDDALTSLDPVTEALITTSLTEYVRDRTVLFTARRPSAAAQADTVVWLQEGRVQAHAPHHALWQIPAYRAEFGESA
ncbi:ABC transporter ATP-binding protein [Streptomyces globisporus]|uniref:ABC transporter ATP-binding protein n=1 Tax=Streptomyces globisporus TaxID=1908 RepID=UPI003807D25A